MTAISSTSTAARPNLADPDTYADGPPHELFIELRATTPVYWQEMSGSAGYWAILRHADVETVARQPLLFSSAAGGVVLEDLDPPRLEQMRGMLLAMDPPRHRVVRKPLTARLTPRALAHLEDDIRTICREVFEEAAERGTVEFVHDVAAHLPTRVVGRLMGLPREDWDRVHRLAERITHGQDPDFTAEAGTAADASAEMGGYAYQLAISRQPAADAADNLTDFLLTSMDPVEFATLFVQLVTAGQDTTQTLLSSGLLALIGHRDQLERLRADAALIPSAVEEMARWANPLHYFRRTATADTELNGQPIRAGDKVAMYYTSANRDESVFCDAQQFDVGRTPNKHLSFGQAEHFCVGVHLARLESRIFFAELLRGFHDFELAGEPRRLRSNLNNSYKSLPIHLTPSATKLAF
ncbi:MAG TPA: cytochrome P450 [Mycobacteriales bacterium]|nr:cytochrome P450 [Mycobacteriales bacterium]